MYCARAVSFKISSSQWTPNTVWHMPHGISHPHSTPRSSNFYSLLWDSSTSLPVSTDTRPSYNISTLRYKLSSPFGWAPFSLDWLPPILALLDVGTRRICQLSTISLQPRAPKTSSSIPDCPTTLMQDFDYRNELLARNSTDKLSAPAGADHQFCFIFG